MKPIIEVCQVYKSWNEHTVLQNINFEVYRGEMFGIIGPNGSGKSTLLKLISGLDKVSSGTIKLKDGAIARYQRKQLAQWLAVLQQSALPELPFTVQEVIEMGRYPYQNWMGQEQKDCSPLIEQVLHKLGIDHLRNRTLEHLSGGERQRVSLAQVMVQEPEILLLDEPTTFLDIGYQIQMMDTVNAWRQEQNVTVIAVLHDLNLAAQYCDRLMVLQQGEIIRIGTPEEIINTELIEQVYHTKPVIMQHPVSLKPQILLQSNSQAK